MNKLGIEAIDEGRIKIEVLDSSAGIYIKFTGEIDMEDPSLILDPLFEKIHNGAIDNSIKEVAADFKELTFLNSSGIKAVAKWIMKLSDMDDASRYIITVIHNKSVTWQVTSLPTLSFLVPGAVQLQ
ncbi:MAG: hypothetical protein JXR70_14085 [Spirochaetales bacterium]|nr:hypothetical protein [Spirochaetales bacterium]